MPRTSKALVIRGRIVGHARSADIHVERGVVTDVSPAGRCRPDIGSSNSYIGPTLFDIQVNGYGGVDLQSDTLSVEDLFELNARLNALGVSRWVPTLVTGPQERLEYGCRIIGQALLDRRLADAVPGIHLEGPYISPEDGPRGAHPKEYVRRPDIEAFDRCLTAAGGKILYTTVAPEIRGAIHFIRDVIERRVVVGLGHHAASADVIARAVDAGARLSTHLGNGLAPYIPRHANPIWAQLAEDRLTASLIPDLEHLPAPVLKAFVRAKGPERVVFTSDCVHLAGVEPGHYGFAGSPVEVKPSGRICLEGTELLAGSGLALLQGVVYAAYATDLTLEQAFACATTVPSRLLGLRNRSMQPRPRRKADFIVFDIDKTQPRWKAQIQAVFIKGERTA